MLTLSTLFAPRRDSYFVIVPLTAPLALLGVACFVAIAPLTWVLGALAATLAFLLALIFPWLAWLGLAFALPIASGWRIGPASLTDIIFIASLALWCAATISRRRPLHAPPIPIWPVALYILTLYLSTLGSTDLGEALTEMVKWIEFAALLVVVPLAMPAKAVPWLVTALLAAAALQGLHGLYQFIFRIGPDWFLIQGRFMRASGVFGQPNPFGAYMGLSLPVAASLSLWGLTTWLQHRKLTTLLWTFFYLAAAVCIGVGLVASWSRGAWLGALGGIIVVLAFYSHRTALLLGLGTLVASMTALLGAINPSWIPGAISARLGDLPAYLGLVDVLSLEVNDDNFAVIERVAHWVAAIRMWELSPWLGVGPGNYATVYPSVALPRWSDPLGHAHNIYLNVLGETGMLGLSAFLLLWTSLIIWLLRPPRPTSTEGQASAKVESCVESYAGSHSWTHALTIGVLGILAHLAIHSFFDNLFVQGMYLHIALWLVAVATLRQAHSQPRGVIAATQHAGQLYSSNSSALISESDG